MLSFGTQLANKNISEVFMPSIQLKKTLSLLGVTFFACFSLNTTSAFAGGDNSGGGHRFGLDAAATLGLIPSVLQTYGRDLVTSDELTAIENIVNSKYTLVMISDHPQISIVNKIKQQGTAYSIKGAMFNIITIYDKDWNDMKDNPNEKISFMAHEVAVLLGLEKTGSYGKISAKLKIRLSSVNLNMQTVYFVGGDNIFSCDSDHYLLVGGVRSIYIPNCQNKVRKSQNGFVCGERGEIITASGKIINEAYLSSGNCNNYLNESAPNLICLESGNLSLLYSNGNRVEVGGNGNCRNIVRSKRQTQ